MPSSRTDEALPRASTVRGSRRTADTASPAEFTLVALERMPTRCHALGDALSERTVC